MRIARSDSRWFYFVCNRLYSERKWGCGLIVAGTALHRLASTTLADYERRRTFGIPAARVDVIHSRSATGRADYGEGLEI
jgi:hypothetical protein